MHVYFMRHGETNFNKLGLCNDDPARDVYLTAAGIQQAEQVARQLQHDKIELIVTSELPRTIQTAEIINRFYHVPIIQHAAINDIRSGFDGQPVRDYFAATDADPLHTTVNGGESLLQHKARVLTYLDWLMQQTAQVILTVAHEETMRVFYAYFNQTPDTQLRSLHFGNCDVLKYQLD
jgi:alpha-ribazole phosphatase